LGGVKLILFLGVGFLLATSHPASGQSKTDSGWVSLFNGRDFEGFYAHYYQYGVVDIAKQEAFRADSGMIHVPREKPSANWNGQGHIFTRKKYSWYRVRVEYRFAADHVGGSQNAGLIVHVDNDQALVANIKDRRPRSIEVNMRRPDASPWTLWSAVALGPYISTTVRPGTQLYLPASEGGVPWTNDPWGKREVFSSLPNPEKPMGEWNQGEARIYGDSLGEFYLNGQLRTRGWNFRLRGAPNDSSTARRIPCQDGGIGLQSEDHEVWYRNFEIMELEPHTLRPLHAKPTVVGRPAPRPIGAPEGRRDRYRLDGKLRKASASKRPERATVPRSAR
jgi:hypothetical protein